MDIASGHPIHIILITPPAHLLFLQHTLEFTPIDRQRKMHILSLDRKPKAERGHPACALLIFVQDPRGAMFDKGCLDFFNVPPSLLRPFPLPSTAPAARHPAPGLSVPCGAGRRPPAASCAGAAGGGSRWPRDTGGGRGGASGGARVTRGCVLPIRLLN